MKRHPIMQNCDKCGARLVVERYVKDGTHFRKYTCPKCQTSEIFRRERNYYG